MSSRHLCHLHDIAAKKSFHFYWDLFFCCHHIHFLHFLILPSTGFLRYHFSYLYYIKGTHVNLIHNRYLDMPKMNMEPVKQRNPAGQKLPAGNGFIYHGID